MSFYRLLLPSALAFLALSTGARAQTSYTWELGIGGSWGSATNWNPDGTPGIGDSITFNGVAVTLVNPDQTANRSITTDGARSIGAILFNTDLGAFTNTIATGT